MTSVIKPQVLVIDTQTQPLSTEKWGRSILYRSGFQYSIKNMNKCNSLTKEHGPFNSTYRIRFEKKYVPDRRIWNFLTNNKRVITTHAAYSCKANIDNVFWGSSPAMTRLLNTWSNKIELYSSHPSTTYNPERSMCLAARDSNLTVKSAVLK
jgi:hypothetical protein